MTRPDIDQERLCQRMRDLRGERTQDWVARRVGVHQSQVSRIERGERPSHRICQRYDALFGTGGELVAAWSKLVQLDESTTAEEASRTNRRDLIGLVASGFGASAAGVSLTSADRLQVLDGARTGAAAVATVESALETVVTDYLRQTPTVNLARVAGVQNLTDIVSSNYVLKPADTVRLWRAAGIAAGIRGWIENNLGRTKDARDSLREAHRRGELIEDNQLRAWTRYMQATVEDYAGNPQGARICTLDGIAHTSKRSPQRALLLMDSLACNAATHGDRAEVDQAVEDAYSIVSTLPTENLVPPGEPLMITGVMTAVDASFFPTSAGRAYARLGLPDRFTDVTAEARADAERDGSIHRAAYCADEALAVARFAKPDPDHARVLAGKALSLATPYQTAHVGHRVDAVIAATKSTPAGEDLAEEVRAWRAARTAPTLAIEA